MERSVALASILGKIIPLSIRAGSARTPSPGKDALCASVATFRT